MAKHKSKSRKKERELTDKQEAFCQFYTKSWNATRAAKDAGYSPESAAFIGYQQLQNTLVKNRISELTEHALKEIGISRERTLLELSRIAFVNIKDLATWNESGVRFKPSDEIDEELAAAIVEVSETVTQSGGTLKIRQHDKVRALELLGKHQKLFADRVEHSGPDGKPIETMNRSELSDEELEAKYQAALAKAQGKGGE